MRSRNGVGWKVLLISACALGIPSAESATTPSAAGLGQANEIRIVELQGSVEIIRAGSSVGVVTRMTNQVLQAYDRLTTLENSRITLRWSDQSVARFGELTEIEILPPHAAGAESGLQLFKGIVSFFHRNKPARLRAVTRGAVAGVEGTEFVLQVSTVDNVEQTTLSVIDGIIRFDNPQGSLLLTNAEQAVAVLGQAPVRTAGFIANNLLQWCFYYPAVLDLRDLSLTAAEQQVLAASLASYQAGDLLGALAQYPADRQPVSEDERIYYAGLLLSVGQVDKTEAALAARPAGDRTDRMRRLAGALRQLIAAVKRQPNPAPGSPQLASEFLAASYFHQSRGDGGSALGTALDLARHATDLSPRFAFAWARVAELEFSFGRTRRALAALNTSLALAPRNAQALALKGFLLAAQNRTRTAMDWFDQAIAADASLGNAWLGRGLCRIRRNHTKAGREDLLMAAALEPQRALLRSYLGKAYSDAGDTERASRELKLARKLDPADPTAWFYSALLLHQNNRINEAIRDLEKAQDLNDNRSVYRSQLLLDEDRAVGSANLARLYRDAGMDDVAYREASRAVNSDYANYSAHLFLATSFDQLRDPNRVNLRYETPAEAEYLLANLLAPVGGGMLSPAISQQEYSKLFERNRLGVASGTEYLSRGAWTQSGAQHGTWGNLSYSLDAFYRWDPGQRRNDDFEERELSPKVKVQVTPQDSVYAQADFYKATGGDRIQYYDPAWPYPIGPNLSVRTREVQDPTVSVGYAREWSRGIHTLALVSRLDDAYMVQNPTALALLVNRTPQGLNYVEPFFLNQQYESELEIYASEVQQIWQTPKHNTIVGGRYQTGDFQTDHLQFGPSGTDNVIFIAPDEITPTQDARYTVDFERFSIYAYHHWQILKPLWLIGGVSYDWIQYPENFRAPPISEGEETVDQVSPKAGLIFTPFNHTTLRGAYTRSLSGASIDQSFQLEPTQVAGFLQSFRSIIPESVIGAEEGARFETGGVSLDQKFPTGTYVGLSGQWLRSELERQLGVYELNFSGFARPGNTRDDLEYVEKSLLFTFNQLIGDEWSVGIRYRLTDADYRDHFVEVLEGAIAAQDPASRKGFRTVQHLESRLHQLSFHGFFNHPSGFLAGAQALWYSQSNQGYRIDRPGDSFWQFNVFVGYRFPKRRAELVLGLLNLTDQDYRLNPLTLYNDLPRERTFAARLQFYF